MTGEGPFFHFFKYKLIPLLVKNDKFKKKYAGSITGWVYHQLPVGYSNGTVPFHFHPSLFFIFDPYVEK